MADEAWEKRRQELERALDAALKALRLHMGTDMMAGESDGHPYATGEWARDWDRMRAIERLKMNIGPGEFFDEDVPWGASFTTDGPDGYVHVFAGQTLREAVDKAMKGAEEKTAAN